MKVMHIPYKSNGISRSISFKDVEGYIKHVIADILSVDVIYNCGDSSYIFSIRPDCDYIVFSRLDVEFNHFLDVEEDDVYKFCDIKED